MNILHLLYGGLIGGLEKLCKDIAINEKEDNNYFFFMHNGGPIYEEMKALNIPVVLCNYNNYDFAKIIQKIEEIITEQKIDVVVVQHAAPSIWISVMSIKRRMPHIKLFVYAHNSYEEIVQGKVYKKYLLNLLVKKADGVIAISEYVKKTVVNNCKASTDKVSVVYNGINIGEFSLADRVWENRYNLIYVGRLIEKKGVQILLQALPLLRNRSKINLKIVGDGPHRKVLEDIVEENGIGQYVEFVGYSRDVNNLLSKSHFFIHPALWEEGFGISIVEAMATGAIPITFRKGAIPEIIDSGNSGFIVDDCSAVALAGQIDMIIDKFDNNRLNEISLNARKKAEEFSIERLEVNLHRIYK